MCVTLGPSLVCCPPRLFMLAGKYRGYQGIKSSDSTEEFSLGERVFPDAAGTRDDDVDVIDVFQEGEV